VSGVLRLDLGYALDVTQVSPLVFVPFSASEVEGEAVIKPKTTIFEAKAVWSHDASSILGDVL
jgi:hypothetical protein